MYTMEMARAGCLRTLTLAAAINRMELFLLPPYLPFLPIKTPVIRRLWESLVGDTWWS